MALNRGQSPPHAPSVDGMTRQSTRIPEEHLRRADPVLRTIIDEVVREGGTRPAVPPDPSLAPDPNMSPERYGVLVRAIISQDISAAASRSISQRLKDRFGGRVPPAAAQRRRSSPDTIDNTTLRKT
jgi:DNA-3-methyladenine glycosylase II